MSVLTATCPMCGRKVYLGHEDTPVCPVCSSPLIEALVPEDPEAVEEDTA